LNAALSSELPDDAGVAPSGAYPKSVLAAGACRRDAPKLRLYLIVQVHSGLPNPIAFVVPGRSKLKTYDSGTINFQQYLDDLEALRKALNQQKLLLVGQSWGAMLALSYAGTYPNHIRAVVSIDAGPIAEDHAAAEEANVIRRLLPSEQKEIDEWEKRKAMDPLPAFREIQRIMAAAYFQDPQRAHEFVNDVWPTLNIEVMRLGYQKEFGALHEFIRSRLRAIRARVLLVHGLQDAVAEGGVVEAHRLIRGSQLALINNCGHVPWLEQPDQLWDTVNRFLTALQK
jgi:proline iminopeptidase